ncbi:hypothetical protein CDD83_342 [Cordyceps sp. RAO-2017]|nr:hypothetical protein CDD83_342 [Cordyceps sp. RAO-2017]
MRPRSSASWRPAAYRRAPADHGIPPGALPCACRRLLSFHPDPLEARRRLGKRQMTGIMPTSSVYPPIWLLDVAPPTTMPRWEPPTSPSYRRQKKEHLASSSLLNRLVGWFDMSAAAEAPSTPPEAQPAPSSLPDLAPDDVAAADVSPTDAIGAEARIAERDTVLATAPTRAIDTAQALPREIAAIRRIICTMRNVTNQKLHRHALLCQRAVRRRVLQGNLDAWDLAVIMEPLDARSVARVPRRVAGKIKGGFRHVLMSAMGDARQLDGDLMPEALWLDLADSIFEMKSKKQAVRLFCRMARVMPDPLLAQVPADRIAELVRTFLAALAIRGNPLVAPPPGRAPLGSHLSELNLFAGTLNRLTPTQRQHVYDDARTYALQHEGPAEERRRLRFSWLAIKAMDPFAPTSDFVDDYRAAASTVGRFSGLQIWQLCVLRFLAAKALPHQFKRRLPEAGGLAETQRWTWLVLALQPTGRPGKSLRELCALLSSLGEFDSLARGLTGTRRPGSIRMEAVTAVAEACDDHRQAMALHDRLTWSG